MVHEGFGEGAESGTRGRVRSPTTTCEHGAGKPKGQDICTAFGGLSDHRAVVATVDLGAAE